MAKQKISDAEIKLMLKRFKSSSEILDQLQYWIGMHYLWIPVYESQIEYGKQAIMTIDDALEE